jgi:hypothetical protein
MLLHFATFVDPPTLRDVNIRWFANALPEPYQWLYGWSVKHSSRMLRTMLIYSDSAGSRQTFLYDHL